MEHGDILMTTYYKLGAEEYPMSYDDEAFFGPPADAVKITKKKYIELHVERSRKALLKLLPDKGQTIHTILRSVSSSGMCRHISLVTDGKDGITDITFDASWVMDGKLPAERHGHRSIKVGGCGMDMGFHLVYNLGRALHKDGYYYKHAWL